MACEGEEYGEQREQRLSGIGNKGKNIFGYIKKKIHFFFYLELFIASFFSVVFHED